MLPDPGNAATSPTLSKDLDDPLLSFPSESDATVVKRPSGFNRVSNETGQQQFVPAGRPEPESSKSESVTLDPLRELAARLAADYSRIQEGAREAEQRSATAMERVQDIELRLGSLAALQDLSRHIDERFAALHALAEEVTVKSQTLNGQKEMIAQADVKLGRLEEVAVQLEALHSLAEEVTVNGQTLNDQKEMIERAVVEAGRVAGLVDAVGTRLARLKDGEHLLELTEARFARLEEVAAETTAQFQRRDRLRDELGLELVRIEMEVQVLTESGRRLQDLGRHTDEQFKALNALAEEVTAKGDTLNNQKAMIEQTAARLERLETVVADATMQLQRSERLRDDVDRELVSLQTELQILTALRHDHPAQIGSVDPRVEPPLPGMEWEPSGSPDLHLTNLVTRLRTPNTTHVVSVRSRPDGTRLRVITYWGAGIGLALFVLASVTAMRPFGKTAQIDVKPRPAQTPLPAQISPAFMVSVPVLSGTNLTLGEPRRPTITTRPPTVATRPPAVETPPAPATLPAAEYFGTLEVESTPAGAAVFVDQRPVGETPLQLLRVRAGSHAVRIERDGYQRWTTAVNVPASEVTRVTAKLDAQAGR